jgi:hypothetical protein
MWLPFSGESGEDEFIEREEYPMCQPVYDSEDLSYSEGEFTAKKHDIPKAGQQER